MMSEKYILSPSCREEYLHTALLPAGLIGYGGISFIRDRYEITRPSPENTRLLWCFGGHGMVKSENREFAISSGMVILLPAGKPHRYWLTGDHWDIFWCVMKKEHASNAGEVSVLRTSEELIWIKELFRRLCSPIALPLLGPMSAVLEQWVNGQYEIFRNPPSDEKAVRLNIFLQQLRTRLGEKWTLKKMISESGVFSSTVHFNRICVKYWHCTAMHMIFRLRMDEAERQLKFSVHSLKNIAINLGYANEYAFGTAFKRYYGVAPGLFRKQHAQT